MSTILNLQDINLTYQTLKTETEAIKNVSFLVEQGEFVSIVGPSGCGKTTILSMISGLLAPSSGKIFLDGEEITKVSTNVGYMFQRDNLFEWLTVNQNILLGPNINHKKNCLTKENLQNLITKYGLAGFEKSKPMNCLAE